MLTPTHQALLKLCRVRAAEADVEAVRRLAGEVDWLELSRLAIRGGVAGLVDRNLAGLVDRNLAGLVSAPPARPSGLLSAPPARPSGLQVPRQVRLQLTRASLLAQAQNQVLLEHGHQLCAEAEAEGLTLIPLKGAALNLLGLYDDPGLRAQCDLDLLTRRDQVQAVDRLLRRLGFEEEQQMHEYELRHSHHLRYRRPGARGGAPVLECGPRARDTNCANGGVLLELHWTGLLFKFARRGEDRRILDRSLARSVRGSAVRMLSPQDLTLLVMLHFCVHRYRAQLKWLVDVAELGRFYADELRWDQIWALARRVGALRALTLAGALARELLDAPIPEPGGRAPLLLPVLRRLNPVESLVTSQPQPSWAERALIDLLEYDSPLHGGRFLLAKGTELLERYRGIRLPVLRRHPLE